MHIKCLRRGTGAARAAADYLVGERDAAGHRREGVDVLRGNPDMVAAVADSLEFEHTYTSVVIAWAPEDRPTDAQIETVLDEFEQTAGRDSNRTATRGRPCCTASAAAASTCMSSPHGATGDGPQPQHRAARLAADLPTRCATP